MWQPVFCYWLRYPDLRANLHEVRAAREHMFSQRTHNKKEARHADCTGFSHTAYLRAQSLLLPRNRSSSH